MSCNNFIPKGELTKYQVDPDAAVDLCFTLYSKDVFEQIFEITANGASSQEIAIDFKVVDSIEYLIFTNNDGGLTDKDIERLRKIGTPGNRGLSEYGVGVRASATAMSFTGTTSLRPLSTAPSSRGRRIYGLTFTIAL